MPPASGQSSGQDIDPSRAIATYRQQAQANGQAGTPNKGKSRKKNDTKKETKNGVNIPESNAGEVARPPHSLAVDHDAQNIAQPSSPGGTTLPFSAVNQPSLVKSSIDTDTHDTKEPTEDTQLDNSPIGSSSRTPSISRSPPYPAFAHTQRGRGEANHSKHQTAYTSPASFAPVYSHQAAKYQSSEEPLHAMSETNRVTSAHSEASPTLQYQMRAQFCSGPPINLGSAYVPMNETNNADGILYRAFDRFTNCARDKERSVLLVGTHGALEVLEIKKDKIEIIGRLEKLPGGVYGAKVLPWSSRYDDPEEARPLVALVIRSPVGDNNSGPQTKRTNVSNAVGVRPSVRDSGENSSSPEVRKHRTTVEVYSLRTQEHMARLLSFPASTHPASVTANLTIEASGRNIAVASGTSGEVWMFGYQSDPGGCGRARDFFWGLGKVWTTVVKESHVGSSASGYSSFRPHAELDSVGTPLLSLSRDWLAVSYPASSPPSLNAEVEVHVPTDASPFTAKGVPPLPFVSNLLDSPEEEGLWETVARGVTQEVLKGAKWVGDQGRQAWNNYWGVPQDTKTSAAPLKSPKDASFEQYPDSFPPTHAQQTPGPSTKREYAVIAVFRLSSHNDFYNFHYHNPFTFAVPYGCSFLSFAPNGLLLLTASRNGDLQFVWDLILADPGKGNTAGYPTGLFKYAGHNKERIVRQVAKFTRMTVTKIIDVAWAPSHGERIAVVTEHGTVHIHDVPSEAFPLDAYRRRRRSYGPSSSAVEDNTQPDKNMVATALNMVGDAVRSRPQSISNALSGLGRLGNTTSLGAKSGKVVAAGVSKSMGAATDTLNALLHVGENRIHLPGVPHARAGGYVLWLDGDDLGRLAVWGDALLRVYNVTTTTIKTRWSRKRLSVATRRPTEHDIPVIRRDQAAEGVSQGENDGHVFPLPAGGYWSPRASNNPHKTRSTAFPLSFAELGTNAPYQPFHTDARVSLSIYLDSQPRTCQSGLQGDNRVSWVFGEDVLTTKVDLGLTAVENDGNDETDPARIEDITTVSRGDDNLEQIVVTTRRKKRGRSPGPDDEEFFEDDLEVVDFAGDRV